MKWWRTKKGPRPGEVARWYLERLLAEERALEERDLLFGSRTSSAAEAAGHPCDDEGDREREPWEKRGYVPSWAGPQK